MNKHEITRRDALKLIAVGTASRFIDPRQFFSEKPPLELNTLGFEQAKDLSLQYVDRFTTFSKEPEKKDSLVQSIVILENLPQFGSEDAKTVYSRLNTEDTNKPLAGVPFVDILKQRYPTITDTEIGTLLAEFNVNALSSFVSNGKLYINLDRVNDINGPLRTNQLASTAMNLTGWQYRGNVPETPTPQSRLASVVEKGLTKLNAPSISKAPPPFVDALKKVNIIPAASNRDVDLNGFGIPTVNEGQFEAFFEEYISWQVNNTTSEPTYFSVSTPRKNELFKRIVEKAGFSNTDLLKLHKDNDIYSFLVQVGHTPTGVDVSTDEKAVIFAIQKIFTGFTNQNLEAFYPN